MAIARCHIVDTAITRYYHCISRCVRQAFLCGQGFEHRKSWIEIRLEFLAQHFAISVCSFAILDNHIHILCRLDPANAAGWNDEEVVRRWIAIHPRSGLRRASNEAVDAWIKRQSEDSAQVAIYRQRLQNLGWFMKALKEPLARLANQEDGCKGAFWEARFKSIAVLDDEALLTSCAYIDLNPVAAGIANTPETSDHTSIKQRLDHASAESGIPTLQLASAAGSVSAARIEADLEQSHWLCPLQDRQDKGAVREGMLPGFSLSGYLALVDWTAQLARTGKARISPTLAGILDRLGASRALWKTRIRGLFSKTHWCGNYFATRVERLQAVARIRGMHHVGNALGVPAVA